ncbi:hypothetical protein [Actinomadura xylanilytica]|uniref:hypothetical protein n=1 Tax=Actinomadura xylanilytica TaxID=887459 RepID=UPI00255A81D4|nr:hypothetical protein [Actinomadura xylanilytica]MDL4777875.1 hypothetical protein [Actinomadura xylanilytica]
MSNEREARREARRKAAHRRVEPDAAPAGETALRSKPVRITVDLTPELYRRLNRWTAEAAEEIDVVKVPLAEVMRAFIRAAEDPQVRGRVLAELRKQGQ